MFFIFINYEFVLEMDNSRMNQFTTADGMSRLTIIKKYNLKLNQNSVTEESAAKY